MGEGPAQKGMEELGEGAECRRMGGRVAAVGVLGVQGFTVARSFPWLGQMPGLHVRWVRILAGQQACSLTWASSASSSDLCLSPSMEWCPRQVCKAFVRPHWPGWINTAPCLLSGQVREPAACPVGCLGLRAEGCTLLRLQVQPAFKIA